MIDQGKHSLVNITISIQVYGFEKIVYRYIGVKMPLELDSEFQFLGFSATFFAISLSFNQPYPSQNFGELTHILHH